jgi:glycosyltransferase involved in cell wall biosynthesis
VEYSIIIPVFRANISLFELYSKIGLTISENQFEVILVYDCGTLESFKICKELENNQNVSLIKLTRNFGQHNAIIAGIKVAKGNWLITMDEDLQHDPADISKLIEEQKRSQAYVVYGDYPERKHNIFRNTTSSLMKGLLKIGIPELYPNYSAFRLIDMRIAKYLVEMNNSYTFLDGYLSWITNSFSHVIVSHNESQSGESSYTVRKLLKHSVNIFVTFSSLPIRLLTAISSLLFCLSTFYAIWIIISSYTIANYQTGFPTLVVLLGLGFGFVILGMAIIGEYIYRINLKATKRPNFIIEENE